MHKIMKNFQRSISYAMFREFGNIFNIHFIKFSETCFKNKLVDYMK